MGRVSGKSILISGGTSGIGRAVTYLMAREGGKVVFAGRNAERGKEIEAEIKKQGGVAAFVQTDITKAEDLKRLVETAVSLHGGIDVLINNAGILRRYDSVDMDPVKHFDEIFNTNVRSYFLLAQAVLPHMFKAGKGSIVNTASVASEIAAPFHSSYAASKGAVRQFTRSLAVELAPRGIRVNAVLPGLTISGMVPKGGSFEAAVLPSVPMGRPASPDEIAPGFLFFASDESSYCTGSLLVIDGGLISI